MSETPPPRDDQALRHARREYARLLCGLRGRFVALEKEIGREKQVEVRAVRTHEAELDRILAWFEAAVDWIERLFNDRFPSYAEGLRRARLALDGHRAAFQMAVRSALMTTGQVAGDANHADQFRSLHCPAAGDAGTAERLRDLFDQKKDGWIGHLVGVMIDEADRLAREISAQEHMWESPMTVSPRVEQESRP